MHASTTVLFFLLSTLVLVPMAASGHGMMWSVEERVIGNATHSEMEELMERMMEGTLTPAEEDRLVDLMNRNPAGYSTMMGRMLQDRYGIKGTSCGSWQGMPFIGMTGILMTGAMVLGLLLATVWLIVGLLAIIWLLRQVSAR